MFKNDLSTPCKFFLALVPILFDKKQWNNFNILNDLFFLLLVKYDFYWTIIGQFQKNELFFDKIWIGKKNFQKGAVIFNKYSVKSVKFFLTAVKNIPLPLLHLRTPMPI